MHHSTAPPQLKLNPQLNEMVFNHNVFHMIHKDYQIRNHNTTQHNTRCPFITTLEPFSIMTCAIYNNCINVDGACNIDITTIPFDLDKRKLKLYLAWPAMWTYTSDVDMMMISFGMDFVYLGKKPLKMAMKMNENENGDLFWSVLKYFPVSLLF